MKSGKKAQNDSTKSNLEDGVRLDKWLWAARFYKTRALARKAIDGGKVEIDGVRAKPGKLLKIGMKLKVRIGYDIREVMVKSLSDKRGPASVAVLLYEETAESLSIRMDNAEQRKMAANSIQYDHRKPEKHQRRLMQRVKRNQ